MEKDIQEWKGQLSASKSAYFSKSPQRLVDVSYVDSPDHARKNSSTLPSHFNESPKASPARRTTVSKTMTEQQKQDMRDGLNCLKVADLTEIRSFKNPPAPVFKVLEAVMIVLGETD